MLAKTISLENINNFSIKANSNEYYRNLPDFTMKCMSCKCNFDGKKKIPKKLNNCYHIICNECLTGKSTQCPECHTEFDDSKLCVSYVASKDSKINNYSRDICQHDFKNFEWVCEECETFLCARCKCSHACELKKIKLLARCNIYIRKEIDNSLRRDFGGFIAKLTDKKLLLDKNREDFEELNNHNARIFKGIRGYKLEMAAKLDEAIGLASKKIFKDHDKALESIETKKNILIARLAGLNEMWNELDQKSLKLEELKQKEPLEEQIMLIRNKNILHQNEKKVVAIINSKRSFTIRTEANFKFKVLVGKNMGEFDYETILKDMIKLDRESGYSFCIELP